VNETEIAALKAALATGPVAWSPDDDTPQKIVMRIGAVKGEFGEVAFFNAPQSQYVALSNALKSQFFKISPI
jgi:hypothetical protein